MSRLAALGVLLVLGACRSKAESTQLAPLPATEVTRLTQSCEKYAAAVCACAAQQPEQLALAERCQLDKVLPESLSLTLDMATAANLPARDIAATQEAARNLGRKCLQGLSDLAAQGCP